MNDNSFICYNTAAEYQELDWTQYENEFGFVPHNYACWSETATCANRFRFEEQLITKSNPSVCECNDGECSWTLDRQDCSRGYEWIRMPINDLASHPLADKIVDFNDPSSTSPQSAFTAISLNSGNTFRKISAQVPIENNQVTYNDENDLTGDLAWVLTQECESGSLEWVEGPFDCSPYSIEPGSVAFEGILCQGDPRSHVMVDAFDRLKDGFYMSAFGRVLGICRFQQDDQWVPGRLVQFDEWNSDYYGTEPQCCPYTYFENHSGSTQGCNWDVSSWRGAPHGHYGARPYQFLYSGNCLTADQARWSDWSEWGECSKTCDNGVVSGTRSKTRGCVNGDIGDYGCHDNTPTEVSEPCGMNLQCQSKGCFLDMNFVDFHRFRLSHVDGVKNSDYWQLNNVYTNRRYDLFGEPRDWSGFFPEGSMVASYRCFDPNTNILFDQEHDATCICNGDECDWDREMPSCTQHGTRHAGYSWFMPASSTEGSFCVAANYGGVGVVQNGKCHVEMAVLPEENAQGYHYFKNTTVFSQSTALSYITDQLFESTYGAFNTYHGDEAKLEADFYELSSACGETTFKWVSAEDFSSAKSVHLPTTFAWLHIRGEDWSWLVKPFRHETAHLCKIDYQNGKTCYGRFVAGKCGDVEVDENIIVSILQIDDENCTSNKESWSDCIGESGANCGPGTQSRDGVERSCRGSCTEAHLEHHAWNHVSGQGLEWCY